MEISKKEFLKLPQTPGVYIFWKKSTTSSGDAPIYIGKSSNLKSRLNSYLNITLGVKTKLMVQEATKVTYIKVTSDFESLLLESSLIKKHKPKYNIVLKDDKHPLYILITKEEFPRILTSRKSGDYGPFPSSYNVKYILRVVRKIFPFSDHKIGKKPCLYSHLGLCSPCPNEIVSTEAEVDRKELTKKYRQNIKNIKLILGRKFNIVRNSLEKEMKKYSRDMDFEKAMTLRDKIKILDYITQERIKTEKFIENPNLVEDIRLMEINSLKELLNSNGIRITKLKRIECYDISHLQGVFTTASMVVLTEGENHNSEYRHFKVRQPKGQSDYDSMREIAKRRIKNLDKWDKPDLIIVDGGLGQVKVFHEACKILGIPVVGIAKNPDRLVFVNGVKVRLKGLNLNITARVRDEAHRFARRLHHKLLTDSFN
ncbi:MAG: GIY-YIG nuclease family protein [bacterium]|nr:MAG: GIY-YIG nuclease family protein [bacterium]